MRAYEFVDGPAPALILETLTGETLAHWIGRSRQHRMSLHDVIYLGIHLCSALHYLHWRRVGTPKYMAPGHGRMGARYGAL